MDLETIQLYSTDAFLKEINAKVISTTDDGIILDKTIFYPSGGGQPADKGSVFYKDNKFSVKGIRKEGAALVHLIDGTIDEGRNVNVKIDWDYRYKLMKHHTALHILSAVVYNRYKAKVTGGTIYENRARLDFDLQLFNKEIALSIIDEVNHEIKKDHVVEVGFLSREEADKKPELIRTKINLLPPTITKIRTIRIGDIDLQADGGLHVKSTKEIGQIELLKIENKGKGRKRISIRSLS